MQSGLAVCGDLKAPPHMPGADEVVLPFTLWA